MGLVNATRGTPETDSGLPRGKMYHIACKTWFTSTGSLRPLSFKFEGDDGEIHTVSNLTVRYCEDRNYSGIPSKEYGCEAVVCGLLREFRLIFYCEACIWVMMLE